MVHSNTISRLAHIMTFKLLLVYIIQENIEYVPFQSTSMKQNHF